jgi:hypothetical protein
MRILLIPETEWVSDGEGPECTVDTQSIYGVYTL